MNKPIVCLHRVLPEQGERCDFCSEPQTLYVTLEEPLRLVVCFRCMPRLVKKLVPPQHLAKVDVLTGSLKEFKEIALTALNGLKK